MKSIKWRFVAVYFLLVLAVLLVVASSITGRLEASLIEEKRDNVTNQINSLITTGFSFQDDILDPNQRWLQTVLSDRGFQNDEDIYIIGSEDFENILASKTADAIDLQGTNVYTIEKLNPALIKRGYLGEKVFDVIETDTHREAHLVIPIVNESSNVKGLVYSVMDLSNISNTITRANRIMLDSGLIALGITIVLSFIISNGITSPIVKATEVAKSMSEGNFDERIKVKSNDEMGRFADMFNYLAAELKRNIERTEIERAKLDTIFNQMIEGVVAIDSNRKIIHLNDRARELFDQPLDVEPKNLDLRLADMGLSSINFANPFSLEGEGDIKLHNKSYRFIYAPFEDRNLNVGGVIVVYQDMTKERKLEEMRREFVANVSHELKTPITSIKSYAETLMKYPVDEETKMNFLEVIDQESDRMAHIVSDLLTLTTLEYSSEEKELKLVNLTDIAKSAAERMKMAIADKNQALYTDFTEDLHSFANEEDLLQVVINLISNAVKYTPSGGIINVGTWTDGRKNYISVKDNGMGIAKKDQARIFERFYRVEKSRSRAMGGTGLGLAIAKEMVDAMKGDISLESEVAKGSIFTISFEREDKDGEA